MGTGVFMENKCGVKAETFIEKAGDIVTVVMFYYSRSSLIATSVPLQ